MHVISVLSAYLISKYIARFLDCNNVRVICEDFECHRTVVFTCKIICKISGGLYRGDVSDTLGTCLI